MTTLTNFNKRLPEIKKKAFKEFKLDLGCGENKLEGYIGMDMRDCGQEIVWDAREGIPLADESVDFIWSSHVIEHFTDEESEQLFREIYRVLKTGGKTEHMIPHATDPTAFYFDHKTFWNEQRIHTLPGVPGLEGFKVIKNVMTTRKAILNQEEVDFKELLFTLEKI